MALELREPDRLGETTLADGRTLAWAEWGPPAGPPVLLCPGAATSRRLGFGTDLLDRADLRLISVDRPGLGGSSPHPGRTLVDFAADVRQLAAARDLHGLRAVGFSQGAPFALACAAGGVVERVVLVSGTDELAHPDVCARLPPPVQELVGRAGRDPVAAEAFFAGLDADRMWSFVVDGSSAHDRAVLEEPALAAAYRAALADAFAPGPAGYARDALLTFTRWPFDAAAIRARVHLLVGAHDASPVHSPDRGEHLAARLPGATREVLADAGGTLLWTHAAAVLDRLA